MAGGFSVDPAAIGKHAATVAGAGRAVGEVRRAAVGPGLRAADFGPIAGPSAGVAFETAMRAVLGQVTSSAGALDHIAGNLQATAASYARADEAAARDIRRAGE